MGRGFKLLANKRSCRRIHLCDRNRGGCSQICIKRGRGRVCRCRRGFKLLADRRSCQKTCQKSCPRNLKRVCASNGRTYGNKCLFEIAQCQAKKKGIKLIIISQGRCKAPKHPCNIKNGGCNQICRKSGWKTESCSKKKLFLCHKKINYGCVKCQARAAMIQISTPGTHIPDCDKDDSFAALQCKGIRCWCVNKMGGMIKGTIRHKKIALDCNARRKKTTSCQIMSLTQKWLKCDPNGDFSALQCVNSKHCWCSMADGVMIPKTHHSTGQKGAPNCAKHRGLTFDCKKNLGTYSHPFEENRFIYCSHEEPYTSVVNVFSCLCPSNLIYPPGKGNFCQKPGDVPGGNPCDKDNGGCDGLCTNSGKNAVCSCPKGWQLQADKKTCNKK